MDKTKVKKKTKKAKAEKGKVLSLVKKEFTALSSVKKEFTPEQKEFIKSTLAPTLLENEILLFIYRAQKLGLNPLNGEIFAYGSYETINGKKVRKLVVIVARDGKRKVAFRTNHIRSIKTEAIYTKKAEFQLYANVINEKTPGDSAPEVTQEKIKDKTETKTIQVQPWEGGTLWGATCKIVRDDFSEPFVVIVPISEYKRNNRMWNTKPETMIKKVAESQCCSLAAPELLTGVYDEAERWDNGNGNGEPLKAVEGGDRPASETQLATIGSLSSEKYDTKTMTKQEAVDLIKELSKKKGKKK